MNKKVYDQRNHAKRRASERYNLQLNKDKFNELIAILQHNFTRSLVIKQSHRVSVHLLHLIDDSRYLVVYDNKRKTIVTFLPKELINDIERNRHNLKTIRVLLHMDDDEEKGNGNGNKKEILPIRHTIKLEPSVKNFNMLFLYSPDTNVKRNHCSLLYSTLSF